MSNERKMTWDELAAELGRFQDLYRKAVVQVEEKADFIAEQDKTILALSAAASKSFKDE